MRVPHAQMRSGQRRAAQAAVDAGVGHGHGGEVGPCRQYLAGVAVDQHGRPITQRLGGIVVGSDADLQPGRSRRAGQDVADGSGRLAAAPQHLERVGCPGSVHHAMVPSRMKVIEGVVAALAWCEERRAAPLYDVDVEARVTAIIEQVRSDGDAALLALTERFDGVRLATPVVAADAVRAGAARVAPRLAAAIDLSIARVDAYYRQQLTPGFEFVADGARLGMLVKPLASVGCYVPGGTAPLFSSLIMTAVPARVAGVGRLVVATPPDESG